MADAAEWARSAEQKRPQRPLIFQAFGRNLAEIPQVSRVLELGSGPGFLAQHLLKEFPIIEYVALDFSPAMHELAHQRLGPLAKRVTFVERSFRNTEWTEGLDEFECVVTLQSAHELRHKSRAPTLHEQVRGVLVESGTYAVCDYFAGGDGGMGNSELYMTVDEQELALRQAGFSKVENQLILGSLSLFSAAK